MTALPPDFDAAREVSVNWKRSKKGTKIKVGLGQAQITISTTEDDPAESFDIPFLVQALPQILEVAYTNLEEA